MDRRPGSATGTLTCNMTENMTENMTDNLVLTPCSVSWNEDQPVSTHYQDIYHSKNGRDEVERIFLNPADTTTLIRDQRHPYIGEIGFGTGLNFIVLAQQFLEQASGDAHLHFISFEAEPFSQKDFRKLSARRSKDDPLYIELAEKYPPLIRGWHRRHLAHHRITVSIYFGEAIVGIKDLVSQQRRPIDLWLLDGFDPKQNPSAWQPDLFEHIKATCGDGSQLTTFTVAGQVRRNLASTGFKVEKIDQQPHKRHSLKATLLKGPLSAPPISPVNIIGAGMAGAAAARALANRGVRVKVFEDSTAGAATSAIPCALLHPRLLTDRSTEALTRVHTYLYAQAIAAGLTASEVTGVLQKPGPNADQNRLNDIISQFAESGDWVCAHSGDMQGVLYPGACVVDGSALVRQLLNHPLISLQAYAKIDTLNSLDGVVVIACANRSHEFSICRYLEQSAVAGQLDWVITDKQPLRPLVADGYQIPDGPWLITGATYEHTPWSEAKATQHNLRNLDSDLVSEKNFRGIRSVSSDRQPIIGALYDAEQHAIKNRFVTTAHGSSGTSSTLWGGEILASQIMGEIAPASNSLLDEVSPQRFRRRQARRGYRHGASS